MAKRTLGYRIILELILFLGIITISYSQENCFRVSLNCHPEFINVFRHFDNWRPSNFSSETFDNLELDEAGYPYHLWADSSIECYTSMGSQLWEDSTYILRWEGEGTVSFWDFFGAHVVIDSSASHYMKFHVWYDHETEYTIKWQHVWLKLKGSNPSNLEPGTDYDPDDPADAAIGHVRNVRIYLASQEDLYENQKEIFDPYYVNKAKDFYLYRFMGVFKTNPGVVKSWNDRTPPHWRSQSSGYNGAGMSYEYGIAFCNQTKSHMWFNVPHAADDHAVRKMAELVRDNLDTDLNVYVEYGNETWNAALAFRAGWRYVTNVGYNGITGVRAGHAALSVRTFKIWRDVFGEDSMRVKRVMATQSGHHSIGIGRIEAAGPENIDYYSPTYYYGGASDTWNENTTESEMIQGYYDNIRGGNKYEVLKRNADIAKQYGLKLFCYEGGTGGDPEPPEERPYWKIYSSLQTNPEMRNILREWIDSLASLGFEGGNELGLHSQAKWKLMPNGIVGFWGLYHHDWEDPSGYPKYMGYMDRIKNCDNLIVNKDTIGSGLAIRLDGHDDYIDASTNGYKPNDNSENYTIEIWVKPEQLDRTQYIFSLAHGLGDAGNSLILKNTNRFNWTVKNNAGTQIVTIDGSTVKVDKFYHITLVKNNTIYKLYINGVLKGAQQGFVSGDCTRNRFIFGARLNSDTTSDHFRGKLDEVRIWNTPLTNLNVLRNWMCRKLTPQHPSYTNLVNYFRFDIVDLGGVVKERKQGHDAQLKNVGFSHYSNYQNSGAPIGDDSKQIYPPDWNTIALSYTHSNGDMMTVTRMGGGDPEGVHVYMVNQKPNDTRLPNDAYFNMGDYYYGIFMAGGNDPEYELIYDYEGNPKAGDATNHRLLKRNDNSDAWDGISGGWRNAPAKLTTTTNTLSTRPGSETYRSEYIFVNRETRITNVSGPGNAIKFDGADTTYAQIIPFSKPSGAYTVSSWCKLDHYHEGGWLFHFPGGASSPVIPGGQRYVGVKVHSNDITLKIGGISANAENNALFDANTGWNHVALVMENKKATVYVNGIPVPDLVDINIGEQDVNATKVYVGHQFKGTIDEFRVWNMALDSITIRKWLCRKISEDHPYKNEYLTGYYQCDEGEGTLIENARGGSDMELVGNVQWVRSGAPLGDTSVYMYGATTLGMDHPDRGRLSIQLSTEGGWEDHLGAHLYRVDNAPQNTPYPVAGTRSVDTTHYWGAFIVPRANRYPEWYKYDITYNYTGNPNVNMTANENSLRLVSRKNNACDWKLEDVPPVTADNTITLTYNTKDNLCNGHGCYRPAELMLAGLDADNIQVTANPPSRPAELFGKTIACAGENNVLYYVNTVSGATYYIWELPTGMSGYSESDSIYVTVDAAANGNGRIRIKAGNRWGESEWRVKDISIQATPSLEVEIDGPAEVCAHGEGIGYSIPPVTPAPDNGYIWEATGDATVEGVGRSVAVTFGTENTVLTVHGRYNGCGNVVLNTMPVRVYTLPAGNVSVTGNRICKGVEEFGKVIIAASESGVRYQAYKNGGNAPIGDPGYGNGAALALNIPVTELLPGNNTLTIKASVEGCNEVVLDTKPTITIDVAPDPDLSIYLGNGPLCKGDSAKIIIENSPADVHYSAFVDYDWSIDARPPFEILPPFISENGNVDIVIPPATGHQGLNGRGVALGPNRIFFNAKLGACPTVWMTDTVTFSVPHSPRTLYWRDFDYWKVPVPPEDTIDFYLSETGICSNEPFYVTLHNGEAGVTYTVVRIEQEWTHPPRIVKYLSEPERCNSEGATLRFAIPGDTLSGGLEQKIGIEAIGSGCGVVLGRIRKIDVIEAPDTSLEVMGTTVCPGENGVVTIVQSQEGIRYQARVVRTDFTTSPQQGDGNDIAFTIPERELQFGENKVVVEASTSACSNSALTDTAVVNRVTSLDGTLAVGTEYRTYCRGNDIYVIVRNPQEGVNYAARIQDTFRSDTLVGRGDSIVLSIPRETINDYVGAAVSITVRAWTRGGACSTDLNDIVNVYVKTLTESAGYPIKSIDGRARVQLDPWLSNVCFEAGDPAMIRFRDIDRDYNGLYFRGIVDGEMTSVPAVQVTDQYTEVPYARVNLPAGDNAAIGLAAVRNGCPPQKPVILLNRWRNREIDSVVVTIPYNYNLDIEIINDTICLGESGTIYLVHPRTDTTQSFTYRLYDHTTNKAISTEEGDARWNLIPQYAEDGNLALSVINADDLQPGENRFSVQVRAGSRYTHWCNWTDLNTTAIIYVNDYPERNVLAEGSSLCDDDGTVSVNATEEHVYYQPYMGGAGVAPQEKGNGATLTFTIPKDNLGPGVNWVTVQATAPGCAPVSLDNPISIENISTVPAKPGPISGETQFCGDATDIIYRVPFDVQASSYTWQLPQGATTNSTSNIALVDFGSTGGNITVTANNTCGASAPSDPLAVAVFPDAVGGTVSGPDTAVCAGSEVALRLSGHTGDVTKWQWSVESGIWNDIVRPDTTVNHTIGDQDVSFRAVVGSEECGQVYSSTHTVRSKPCLHVTLGVPVPTPPSDDYTQKQMTVTFEPSGQDSVRDIYYVVCSGFTQCSIDSAKRYDPTAGIVLDIVDDPKRIVFQARPKPGKESTYLPSAIDTALYVYSIRQLGVPVPNPGSGPYETVTVDIVFERTEQTPDREIYYTICDDTIGCELTQGNRQLYDSTTGIVLDISRGKKGIVFQAVPLDPTKYAASKIGKALYIYKPGIVAVHGVYFDTDADGRIDRAKVTFNKDLPRLPQSVIVYAPYDKSESVVVMPQRLSEREIVLDFSDREFSRQVTGFDTGLYGKVSDDAEGFFNPDPFPVADSVAPVIESATYTMVGKPDGGSYNDTLTVTFSEAITQSGTDPFVYFGTNPSIGLTQISVDGNRLRAIVPVSSSDKSNTLQPGDSIAIRTGAGNSIGDTKGNIQTNPDNIRVPVRIVPPSDFFRLRSGPTLFDPSQRQFMVSIAPNERISVLDHQSKGTITIYDGVGNVVLSERLDRTQNTLRYIWTGHNHNRRLVGQGTYVVVIGFTMSGMSAKKKMKVGVKR